ncbi:MAG TPA: CocE/NonD family hydrolase [Mycobacterium sp.]|uniref:alpha/beta hydrolase family protein n=1 Tax=Mycolicibacterium sp. TaxID=2320850 RepID=UPI0025CF5D48|nr:CocE/NonD family hydrolase [Mycolicibacterium sp.]HPX36607.1 CocE/NonD family hydrolase [Mycobacterium sp.]HQC76780.1 CocE/NonD family hydrolase [Mycobacterium sp.]
MAAALFVGRVGGLAVALGVGAAVFNGGVAWADSGSADSGSRGAGATNSDGASASAPARTRRGGAASAAAATKSTNKRSATASVTAPAAAAPKRAAAVAAPDVEVVADETAAGSDFVATPPSESTADPVFETITLIDPEVSPIDAQVDGIAVAYAANASDGAGTGSPLLDSPLAWAALAVSRRHPLAAVSAHTPTAATTSQAVTDGGITWSSETAFVDGIFRGTLTATSAAGNTLTYTAVGSSCGDGCGVGESGGKITAGSTTGSYTILPYANWLDGGVKGDQTFNVRITEVTQFDQIITSIPLVGLIASPIIGLLQKTPFLGDLLAPIIGSSVLAAFLVDTTVPGTAPMAFTYKVTSFDGTQISTNFFPASGLAAGQTANTVLYPPGLGSPGSTNPDSTNTTAGSVPGIALLRNATSVGDVAYNVVTWDPRGEFQSGGILQLDNPMYEGRDTSAVIDWVAAETPATLNGSGDPAVGMVGGSYGGGIQMTTVDPRLDSIAPTIAWNSLNESLYPTDVFKTAWANTLALSLLTTGARINNQINLGILTGDLLGFISETAQAVLGSSGPTALLNQLQAPTLLVQGIVDALFPLVQSIQNAEAILANPYGTPVKMIWFCGGHGVCLDPVNLTTQATTIFAYDKAWLNKYVSGLPIPDAFTPNFQWWDQAGNRFTSDLYPFSPGFNTDTPLEGSSAGGVLGILPFAIGGSGPGAGFSFPLNQVFATEASNAINVPIAGITTGDQVVGAPTVSFTYSGFGTSKAVYGQIVDNATGRVLGNIATPIPLTLDGQSHTASVSLADIVYTAGDAPSLTLQIASSATLYWNSSWGVVNISGVQAALPVRA